jgi:hypothetical protein
MSTSVTVSDLRDHAARLRQQADDLDERANKAEEALSGVEDLLSGNYSPSPRRGRKPKATTSSSGRRPGRPKGSKNRPKEAGAVEPAVASAAPAAKVDGRRNGKTSLRELLTQILKKNRTGLTLAELVRAALNEGYKSKTKGKFAQIVYQNLYKLMKDEHSVSKDKDTKKYRLVKAA